MHVCYAQILTSCRLIINWQPLNPIDAREKTWIDHARNAAINLQERSMINLIYAACIKVSSQELHYLLLRQLSISKGIRSYILLIVPLTITLHLQTLLVLVIGHHLIIYLLQIILPQCHWVTIKWLCCFVDWLSMYPWLILLTYIVVLQQISLKPITITRTLHCLLWDWWKLVDIFRFSKFAVLPFRVRMTSLDSRICSTVIWKTLFDPNVMAAYRIQESFRIKLVISVLLPQNLVL